MTTSGSSNPSPFWSGASMGLAVATVLLCAVAGAFVLTGVPRSLEALAFGLVGAVVFFTLVAIARFVSRWLRPVPRQFHYFAAAALGTLYLLRSNRFRFRWDPALFYPSAVAFLAAVAVLFGVYWAWRRGERRPKLFGALVAAAVTILAGGAAWIADEGRDPHPVDVSSAPAPARLDAPNPAEPGRFEVEALTYGSGTDRRRPEYGDEVDLQAPTVDASKILPEWKGFKATAREWYWGFSIDEAPLNARVWLPVGDGPFPLVLVVHGNHAMEDYSESGYAYLGELLASRGFIVASIDENYINGTWSGDFRGEEMPMRAWLLLEHLRLWRDWNATEDHRFHGGVDTERIALIGHSRGGEAVSLAYAFNELERFPDDATVRFDYGFSIRALVAMAQTDRHYPRRVELDNVHFLTLQGSYDSDEASSFGMRQFRRIHLDDERYRFKAGLYIHGANHGQFNTTWGMDSSPPGSWLLNREPLIAFEDQLAMAKVSIAAFLETALHDDLGYVPFFRDPRVGAHWLPEGILCLAQFQDSTFEAVASFEEDLDVTTASLGGASIEAHGLTVWREEALRFRDDLTQGTNGVVLGPDGEDAASYTIQLGEHRPSIDTTSALTFFLSSSTEEPGGDESGSLELGVELVDDSGGTDTIALNDVTPMAPPLKIQFLKLEWLNRKRFPREWEPTFQSFDIPLGRFQGVDVDNLAAIRFRIEGSGVVILDDIGFRR